MSQTELDEIQLQLKIAIQNHQKLVSKIQLQPQDHDLKTQLHNLQKDIMTMSQKQKLAVQKLRKDLMERQSKKKNSNQNMQNNEEKLVDAARKRSSVPVQPVSPLRVPQYPSHKSPGSQESIDDQNRQKSAARTPEKKQLKSQDPSLERARELKKKLDFMACIDLVPPDSIRDTPGKRSERKRKSTNNPNFAYGFELERRPKLTNFLASDYFGAKKTKPKPQAAKSECTSPTTSRPTTPSSPEQRSGNNTLHNTKENMPEENLCHICQLGGQLLNCDTCRNVYHLQCLNPPLYTLPAGQWCCPKCQVNLLC
ncbi:PHD finger protein 21A-like [Mercenaria mercenaria]|uniref:PHD finger protein 21A-like n=1 Tax=Mercenaria mercenaria TaxID=6596 RepID=UPI00234E4C14|nr:PHD finger protein 21A-like [Mercenaria mercenaria]